MWSGYWWNNPLWVMKQEAATQNFFHLYSKSIIFHTKCVTGWVTKSTLSLISHICYKKEVQAFLALWNSIILMTDFYVECQDQEVLRLRGFLNNTVYFGTLMCPFSTKSLLRLRSFLLTWFFPKSQKTAKAEDPLYMVK